MKKYLLIISALFIALSTNSCRDKELDMFPPYADEIDNITNESQLQQLLNGGYLSIGSVNAYGTKAMIFGDLMGDHMFVNTNPSFLATYNYNFNASQQGDFAGLYDALYNSITKCNLVINNKTVPVTANVVRLKAEARTLRAFAYFTLVRFYSPSPTSGQHQEYGVPLVLENYDVNIQPARATVAQVYIQIIADLNEGIANGANDGLKTNLTKTAAKLILSKVYLTRRAAGDAALALQLSNEIINSSPGTYGPIPTPTAFVKPKPNLTDATYYLQYFGGFEDEDTPATQVFQGTTYPYTIPGAENHLETIWELDVNKDTNLSTGIGSNIAIPAYYFRLDAKKAFLFNKTFYDSFAATDVRRGPAAAASLLTATGVPATDSPKGYWTNKYPQVTKEGRYLRNIKMLRFSEAYLNRIEALYLTGQNALALTELNAFAASRNGSLYTGTDLLQDILAERSKEFYGEGQRFHDIKRYNLPLERPSNCATCSIPANDKLFVIPVSQGALNSNANLTQYPGW